MDTTLPQDISDFADACQASFARVGGPQAALAAETDPQLRDAAAIAFRQVGGGDLTPRTGGDDSLAAAVLCRAAGAALLPYPVVDEVLAIDGARLGIINARAPRVDHGDLAGAWLLTDLDATAYLSTMGQRGAAKLGPFLVPAELEAVGSVPETDVTLHLILDSWRILGGLERALSIACEHVKVRQQFGHPLASFQAVRFSVADADVAVRGLGELCKFTVWRWRSEPSSSGWTDAIMLKIRASETAVAILRTCHQLLGALGFCDESDISVIDRHMQPLIRLPLGADDLATLLASRVYAGDVETLFSEPVDDDLKPRTAQARTRTGQTAQIVEGVL